MQRAWRAAPCCHSGSRSSFSPRNVWARRAGASCCDTCCPTPWRVATAIRIEASLSFLGLGIQPPTPSWGNLLTHAATNIFIAPLQVFLPGLFIFLALMSFNLLGDALRDALDPRLAERGGK